MSNRVLLTVSIACIAASVAAMVSCSNGDKVASQADIYRAQAALQPFKKDLRGALLEGLEEGPRGAIMVCKSAAPALAARRSEDGMEMGRTSHKLRNPNNAPADWVKPLLAAYTSGAKDPHLAVVLDDGRIGYVEPIFVQKPCLMCHGETIAPSVAEQIAMEYPGDEATGFGEGDFRGLFWVTMPPGADQE
jgi:hypothetical protein